MSWSRRALRFAVLSLLATSATCTLNPQKAKQRYLESGNRYAEANQYREAIVEYQNAIRIDPKFGEAHRRLGAAYLSTREGLFARISYTRAADLMPDNTEVQLEAGAVLLVTRKFDDAAGLAEKVLAREPKNVRALVLRANAMAGMEDLDTAIRQIEEAIRLDPDASELYSNLGSFEATSGQLKDAEGAFKQAIEVTPDSASAHAALGNFYWATRRPRHAEQMFLKAVTIQPPDLLAHRALATFYIASARPMEAEKYVKAVADIAGDVDARLTLADYYLLTRRREQGMKLLEEVATQPGGRTKARARLAAVRYTEGARDEAHQIIDEVLAREKNAQALFLKARFLWLEHKNQEALQYGTAAVDSDPTLVHAYYLIGQLHMDEGDLYQAGEAYKAVLKLNPHAAPAQIQLSRILHAQGAADSSLDYALAAIRDVPDDRTMRLTLVRSLLERRDLGRAQGELEKLIKQYPQSAPVHSLMGNLHLLKRNLPEARRWLEGAFKRDPQSIETLSALVALDLVSKRPGDARARIEALVAKAPRRTDLLLLLAKTYAATSELAKTEQTLRKTIEIDPSNLEAYGMLGQIYYEQGRLEDGKREFEMVLEKQPKAVAAHTMLGIILKQQNKVDESIERYQKALAIDSQAAVAANNLAWIYAELGRNLEEAVLLARTAKRKLPNQPGVADTLGWVYYRTGLLKLAVPYLQESVEKSPKNPLYRYHLGAAYARGGDAEKARAELERALKLDPQFHGAAEVRRILATLKQ